MYFLYGNERTEYIVKSVLEEPFRTLTDSEFRQLRDTVLSVSGENTVILDMDSIFEDPEDLKNTVNSIRTVEPSTDFIVFASGYDPDSTAIRLLNSAGVYRFITAVDQTGMKEGLSSALNGEMPEVITITDRSQTRATEPLKAPGGVPPNRRFSVAVAGSMPRIGTTTQALQITKSLIYLGYTACCMEMNAKGFIDDVKTYYAASELRDGISIDGLDMYYQKANISVLKDKYDVIVYDYGDVITGINYLSWSEKDYRYCVVGISPSEQKHIAGALRKLSADRQPLTLVFSLVPKEDEKSIREQMKEDRSIGYHIAPYTPEPLRFEMANAEIYQRELETVRKEKKKSLMDRIMNISTVEKLPFRK